MATNSKKTETLVGVFLFLGLAMLGTIILLFGNIGDLFKKRYEIKVNFKEAAGIIKGSTVRLRGAKIGEVAEKPKLVDSSMIQVILAIDEDHRIEKGAFMRISQASLLGDKEILITPPSIGTDDFIEQGETVKGAGPGGLDFLQSEAELIAGSTREVIEAAEVALSKIEESVDEVKIVASKLSKTVDKVNGQILSAENIRRFDGMLANLEKTSASFAKLGEKLEPAIGDFRLAINEVRETNQTAQSAIARVSPALQEVPRVLASIERTADSATAAIEKIDDQDGALGALVADKQLKTDMKDFVRNLKKGGILGYKDEEEKEEDPRDRFHGRRR
ncbi:MlaD family protein [Akkermansiaceae bacterium]|nr:MlaD family protein [Akkermansiaceae bacterium]